MNKLLREPRRILIVDDHPIVRQGIESLLAQEPDLSICGEAESAGEDPGLSEERKLS